MDFKLLWVGVIAGISLPAAGRELCFDFTRKVVTPLLAPIALKRGEIHTQKGKREKENVEWGAGRAIVPMPIQGVYAWLIDHTNWKDMSKTRIRVTNSNRPGYMDFHTMEVDLNVWAFITLNWVEQWAYAITKGTMRNPLEYVISYQKTLGSHRVDRLCGSIVLKRVTAKSTDVYLYEEARAERYEASHIENMHRANLERLGKKREEGEKE